MQSLLIVQMNPAPSREEEFNDWYSNLHIRDVMRMDGSISAQRFVRSATQAPFGTPADHRYLACYEVADTEALSRSHAEAAGTDLMVTSDAADMNDPILCYYFPIAFADREPRNREPARHALCVQVTPQEGDEETLAAWCRELFPKMMATPGARRGWLAQYLRIAQMVGRKPRGRLVFLIHLDDPALFLRHADASDFPLACEARITLYDAITDRITPAGVRHSTKAQIAAEQRARAIARETSPPLWQPQVITTD